MQLEHQFVVPVPVGQAWDVLLDVERIAPCMPGASVDSFDGETVAGKVKVKVGPIQVTYAGEARFVEKDEAGRRMVLDARGKEARGTGTATAKITSVMTEEGGSTRVTVTTDLTITGKPAQFGRGVMVEVGNKLLGRFADCLAEQIGGGAEAAPPAGAGAVGSAAPGPTAEAAAGGAAAGSAAATSPPPSGTAPAPIRRLPDDDAIDLLDTAGLPVLKRLAPVAVGVLLLLVLWRLAARRR